MHPVTTVTFTKPIFIYTYRHLQDWNPQINELSSTTVIKLIIMEFYDRISQTL